MESMTMQMENGLLFSIEICVNEFMHKLRANLLLSIRRRTQRLRWILFPFGLVDVHVMEKIGN